MYIVPRTQKIHRCSEDRELNQARSRTDPIDRPVRTARATAHHYSGAQHCSTETALLIFSFLRTNITSQMWPSGGKGTVMDGAAASVAGRSHGCLVVKLLEGPSWC